MGSLRRRCWRWGCWPCSPSPCSPPLARPGRAWPDPRRAAASGRAAARGRGRGLMPLAINGRFLSQRVTGVQRFATEITRELDFAGRGASACPMRGCCARPAGRPPPSATCRSRPPAFLRGQAWEQSELPLRARGCTLVNLGNTAPLAAGRNQIVVIHDAGAFDTPESYSTAFRAWYRALHLALPRVGARIATVSEFSRGRIAHHLKLDPARIGVMPEGAEHILRAPAETAVLERHRAAARPLCAGRRQPGGAQEPHGVGRMRRAARPAWLRAGGGRRGRPGGVPPGRRRRRRGGAGARPGQRRRVAGPL